MKVKIIGAGLAGCEAAWYLANHNIEVELYEMRPQKMTEAHKTAYLAELVCSNSLKSLNLDTASGVLKKEMEIWDSIVLKIACKHALPAGAALAVCRDSFALAMTEAISNHPLITLKLAEVDKIDPDEYTIIATGPLTSSALANDILDLFGNQHLYFFDAAAPIIKKDSINMDIAYYKSRYDKGEADYLNCPMTKEQFLLFHDELIKGQRAKLHSFDEDLKVFEGCMPIEIMAMRGTQTLTFGPLKPRGLEYNGQRPYAVVQLRQDNAINNLYNLVGFQTNLTYKEQQRIFRLIPGLENAEFVKYGVMHKNTYLNSPQILNSTYQTKKYPKVFLAGQLTGVEGYLESASSGIYAAINMERLVTNKSLITMPEETIMGALSRYISNSGILNFIPMNANFGILPEIIHKGKKERKLLYAQRAILKMEELKNGLS